MPTSAAALALALLPLHPAAGADRAAELAATWAEAIEDLNRAHARRPKASSEEQLAEALPRKARQAFDRLLAVELDDEAAAALAAAAEAALGLALVADFDRARARLAERDPRAAAALGCALARPRFLLLGRDGVPPEYLETFAEVLEAVLEGYDALFGFEEWSKVPGKKLRVRVHRVERIERPPHFAPQFPFHSEIDFPVVDVERFASPTADGKFLFYGLCHELGHVIAMWGDRTNEEDHHAWAHYTGVLLVEHLSEDADLECLEHAKDVRWRSLAKERERLAEVEPGLQDRDATLRLLIELHDLVGPEAIGAAINRLDREDRRLRVNGVRYYRFAELRGALLEGTKNKRDRKRIEELLD